jgi:hypothetical protein
VIATSVAYGLSWFLGLGIIFVGARFLLVPRTSAAAYGVAVAGAAGNADAYFAVKGIRDIGSGLVALALILGATPQALGWFMLAAAVIPIGDAIVVLRYRGPRIAAYAVHGGTAVLMLAIAGLLLAG